MNPIDKKHGFYFDDMLISMERIEEYIVGLQFIQFKKHYMLVDAVIRNFEIIGEVSKHIPDKMVERYPHIRWRKMYYLRNIITH